MSPCECDNSPCTCKLFCTPIRAYFDKENGFTKQEILETIQQNKGEAEMSKVDWLIEYSKQLQENETCISIVSSGDIDAVVIHLFAISHLWPRTSNGAFKNDVYVILRKPQHKYDIYNITRIIMLLENFTSEKYFGMKVAVVLSLGGNDFLPKFHSIPHSNHLELFLKEIKFRENLVPIAVKHGNALSIHFNSEVYAEFIKHLYCPKLYDPTKLSFEEVRQITIQTPSVKEKDETRNAQLWMPPKSVIARLSRNVVCLIKYYMSTGQHFSLLPDFLSEGCLTKSESGEIEYDFGPGAYTASIQNELHFSRNNMLMKMLSAKKKIKRKNLELLKKQREGSHKTQHQKNPIQEVKQMLFESEEESNFTICVYM